MKKTTFIPAKIILALAMTLATLSTNAQSYHEGLPTELRISPNDGALPAPIFESGRTKLTVHLLGDDWPRHSEFVLHIEDLFVRQKDMVLYFNDKGVATLDIDMHGTAQAMIIANFLPYAEIWIAPGDDMDVYIDTAVRNYCMENYRLDTYGSGMTKFIKNLDAPKPNPQGYVFTTGRYADLNRLYNIHRFKELEVGQPNVSNRMTGDEFTAEVLRYYFDSQKEIERRSLPQMMKEYLAAAVLQQTVLAFNNTDELLKRVRQEGNTFYVERMPGDSLRARPSHEKYLEFVGKIDINDPAVLMGRNLYKLLDSNTTITKLNSGSPEFYKHIGIEPIDCHLLTSLRIANSLYKQAQSGTLPELTEGLKKNIGPFFVSALEQINSETKLRQQANSQIEKIPEGTPLDKILETILAPHHGKVVLIDFWNTWCVPCRKAMNENEPLKDGELSSPEIVWIYIADDSSPLDAYEQIIPNHCGLHYRLDQDQWKQLTEHDFPTIETIPAYVLVRRDGTAAHREDFHHQPIMIREVKKALEE